MIENDILQRRLRSLDETLEILESLRGYTLEEFLAQPERYGSAERFRLRLHRYLCHAAAPGSTGVWGQP